MIFMIVYKKFYNAKLKKFLEDVKEKCIPLEAVPDRKPMEVSHLIYDDNINITINPNLEDYNMLAVALWFDESNPPRRVFQLPPEGATPEQCLAALFNVWCTSSKAQN